MLFVAIICIVGIYISDYRIGGGARFGSVHVESQDVWFSIAYVDRARTGRTWQSVLVSTDLELGAEADRVLSKPWYSSRRLKLVPTYVVDEQGVAVKLREVQATELDAVFAENDSKTARKKLSRLFEECGIIKLLEKIRSQ